MRSSLSVQRSSTVEMYFFPRTHPTVAIARELSLVLVGYRASTALFAGASSLTCFPLDEAWIMTSFSYALTKRSLVSSIILDV